MRFVYITLDIIAMMFEAVVLIRLAMSKRDRRSSRLQHLIVVSIGMSLVDMFWGLCFEDFLGLGTAGLRVASALYFSSCAIMSYWWFIFVLELLMRKPISNKIHSHASIPALLVVAVSLTNGLTGWMYTIGADCYSYQRGPFYPVEQVCTYGYFFAMMLLAIYRALFSKDKADKRHGFIVFVVAFIPCLVGYLQVYTAYLPYSCVSYSVAIIIIYLFINLQEETEQRARDAENQKKLEEAIRLADAANEAKSNFLFNMSHDIRTPMNAILGYNQMMKERLSDPVLLDYQEKIEKAGNTLLTIINNTLDMARIESGKVELDESVEEAGDILSDIFSVFDPDLKRKNITLNYEMDFTHRHFMCDKTKSREIFINLISNAVKYTPDGGTITVRVTEMESDKEGYMAICSEVIDNGIGMSREFLPHIFDSFSRERNTTTGKVAGTGLGMSIVKKLVDLMGGRIEVESQLGVGTKFTMTLEHRIVDEKEVERKDSEEEISADEAMLKGKRILLAEDNELNAEIAEVILEGLGLDVDRVENGRECVERIVEKDEDSYDLILMDIQMPEMDGYEATRRIRVLPESSKASIPIIAMTANAFEEDRRNALEAGMDGHIAKPIDITVLMSVLASVLNTGN